eukprot:TRINITY_DN994_c0_g1_i3.p3 TRINITY_DN994_c0_g1~~TRINITY_DN994_c0_g1_i3.p3  ORF type:complete len:123 (-),score=29.28 TRINITY_DN994_c0_g1_i3:443-811(-)
MGRDATEQDVFPRREEYDRPRAKRKIKEPERFEIDPHLDDDIMRAIRLSLQQQQSSSSDPQPGGGGSKAGIEPKRLRVERQTAAASGARAAAAARLVVRAAAAAAARLRRSGVWGGRGCVHR